MEQLQQFQHEEFGQIRVIEIEGAPWFVGKDVAAALGYSNSRKALGDHVDEEDKGVTNRDTLGGRQQLTVINESGLYSLILSSKLPAAKKFKRWVTSEILPSIRRHGAYFTPDTLAAMLDSPEVSRKILETVRDEMGESEVLRKQVAELAPKARYYDIILQSRSLLQTSVIAKDYGMSAVMFNRLLHELHIQYRMGTTWLLYQEHAGQGYTKSRTYRASENTSVVHTYWTQKGRLFLYETLKRHGIIPCVESAAPEHYTYGSTPPEARGARGQNSPLDCLASPAREAHRDGASAESPAFSAENACAMGQEDAAAYEEGGDGP